MDAETGAPPPPGADSPVPADAAARAAAAGRATSRRAPAQPRRDALVPSTAIERRAQERASVRRAPLAAAAAMPSIANPAAGIAPQLGGPYGYGYQQYGPPPYGHPQYGGSPYGHPRYGASPHVYPLHGPAPVAPRVAWTRRERSAALLGSWLGQTVMALATHLVTAFALIVGFALLLHASGEPAAEIEADSFTAVVARWTMPDRVWATALIALLVGGALLVAGALLQALWTRAAGLSKPHRSAWLAWLCTTAATAVVGVVVWPAALVLGVLVALMDSSASLTTGTMWATLFWELGIAILLTGGVGMLFGWLFLSTARPRVDDPAVVAAAEAAARARDESELASVGLGAGPATGR